jgi:hypothetical protein
MVTTSASTTATDQQHLTIDLTDEDDEHMPIDDESFAGRKPCNLNSRNKLACLVCGTEVGYTGQEVFGN